MEVWLYNRKEYKQLRFFVDGRTGSIYRKGNKRLNFSHLLSMVKLRKKNPRIIYSNLDKIYKIGDEG